MWQAVAALGVQAATGLVSLAQSQIIAKKQEGADKIAAEKLQQAYGILDKNVYAAIALPMKQFNIQREALAAQGAQVVEAGRESQRGAAATAGSTMAQFNNALRGIQSEAEGQYYDLELAKAQEQARKDDIRTGLKLSEAEGAQAASAMYAEQKGRATNQAISSGIGALGQGLSMVPLFQATAQERAVSDLQDIYGNAAKSGQLDSSFLNENGEAIGFEKSVLKNMGLAEEDINALDIFDKSGKIIDPNKFKDYLGKQNVNDLRDIYKTGFTPSELQQAPELMIDRADGKKVYQGQDAPPYERQRQNPFNFADYLKKIPLGGFKYN